MLIDELAKAKQREQIAAWDRAELALREQLNIPKRELSADVRDRFIVLENWCAEKGVRKLPAKPWVVAAFILEQIANGRDVQGCLALLAAIEAVHDSHNLSNPTATAIVRAALDTIVKAEPPRSWNKDERAAWALLPPEIRQAISRREYDRDKALRVAQNRLGEERNRLRGADETAKGTTNNVTTPQV